MCDVFGRSFETSNNQVRSFFLPSVRRPWVRKPPHTTHAPLPLAGWHLLPIPAVKIVGDETRPHPFGEPDQGACMRHQMLVGCLQTI